ncbi:MAG TPA: low temperature requirement protein A [Gaiellaceae bacterium]|nr:low temperature requirement protein A [Gaiellaceae bacterium]
MASRWHDPPRLRTVEDDEDERHATWLELFFDLVFVVAIAQLAEGLADDPSVHGFLVFAGFFVAVWWAWVGYTFYADRFDTDDPPHRILMIAGMFAVAVLASVIPDAFHGETASFALAYALVRAVVVLLNGRAWWHLPAARPLLDVYIPAFTASILLFLVSAAVEPPYRYALWAVALTIDLGAPLVSHARIRKVPIHASHIPERVGLLTIIVFGESVLAVVVGTTTVSWGLESGAAATLGFAIAGTLWWIYFDHVDSSIVKRTIAAGQTYLYAHLPLLVGLAALGAGVKLGIKSTQETGLTGEVSWLIGGGVALFMASVAVLHLVTTRSGRDVDVWLRVGTALLALGLGAAGQQIGVVPLLAVLAAALAGQIALGLARRERPAGLDTGGIEIG